jgi:hypothetical protein
MNRSVVVSFLTVALILLSASAQALPRFAARTGQKCMSCHVNPSGGGMRTPMGAQYGREELPVPDLSEGLQLEDFTTLIANVMGVGADFRTIYYFQQSPDTGAGSTSSNAFWQMQGDLYLNFRIAKKINLYLDKGLYSGFEAFGLLNVLPASGSVKIGKFVPNYGLKLDDHTAYIRTVTGFSPAAGRPELTGLELAVAPGPATIMGGLFNAEDGFAGSGGNNKAYLGRAEVLWTAAKEVGVGFGGNLFGYEDLRSATSFLYYGGFGMFSVYDFSLIGEVDWLRSKGPGATIVGAVVYGEADYPVVAGVDLKLAYDFYDPDLDLKSGARSRYGFGVEFFPIGGVELRLMYRIASEEGLDATTNEFDAMFHLYL